MGKHAINGQESTMAWQCRAISHDLSWLADAGRGGNAAARWIGPQSNPFSKIVSPIRVVTLSELLA